MIINSSFGSILIGDINEDNKGGKMKNNIFLGAKIIIITFISHTFTGWELITPMFTSNHIQGIYFVDKSTGWVVGYGNLEDSCEIYKSLDSGKTWIRQLVKSPGHFKEIFFIDSLKGWVIGAYDDSTRVVSTINGGNNWNTQLTQLTTSFVSMCFINSLEGWILGSIYNDREILFHSNDGGMNWKEIYSSNIFEFKNIFFLA